MSLTPVSRGLAASDAGADMKTLRFAMFGTGFWSKYQLAGWRELDGVECVALFNRTRAKAEALAQQMQVPSVYDDPEALLKEQELDFIDIVTDVDTHCRFVEMAAQYRIPVICQKPLGASLAEARHMVAMCRSAAVPLFVHENWRWQTAIREVKRVITAGSIGRVFRAGIDMISGFDVFENQPFLAELEHFIITDLGSHTLDSARFLFGEPHQVYCRTARAHTNIRGEDVATIVLGMPGDLTVIVRMAYAGNHVERECFPQTLLFVEGTQGTLELAPDFSLRLTTADGSFLRRVPPPYFPWADPRYAAVHASIVPCNADILSGLRGGPCETTGDDNLRTVELVWAAYDSARHGQAVALPYSPH
jgi:D-apiose dehydrogenase